MSRAITPHFQKLIDRLVASGRFSNKSEVIRAGLRLLEEHEAAAAASRDGLSRIIQTALRDPRSLIPATNLLRRSQRR
jgi:antitoxin ParD1/3/4